MNLFPLIVEFIDFRSFSNLWYWIALASIWAVATHYVLGVPHSMLIAAKTDGESARDDLVDLARIKITRILAQGQSFGVFSIALLAFILACFVTMATVYGNEFAQAILLIALPLGFTSWLDYRACHKIVDLNPDVEQLISLLCRHRAKNQLIGFVAIFITSMWGMWVNLTGLRWY